MGRRKKSKLKLNLKQETVLSLVAVFFFVLAVLVMVSFTGQGKLLQSLNDLLQRELGMSVIFVPFACIAAGLMLLQSKWAWSKPHVLLGTLLAMFGWLGFFRTGDIGAKTFQNTSELVSSLGASAIFLALIVSGFLVVGQFSLAQALEKLGEWREKLLSTFEKDPDGDELDGDDLQAKRLQLPKINLSLGKKRDFSDDEEQSDTADSSETTPAPAPAAAKPEPVLAAESDTPRKLPLASQRGNLPDETKLNSGVPTIWEYPPTSLLSNSDGGAADRGDVNHNADVIEATLESFGIRAKVQEVSKGPAVTQYALEIARGTKLSKVTALATDLAMALAAPTGQIRIEAPIAGKSLVGVEVPNHSAQFVTLRKMLESKLMKKIDSKLAVALGLDVGGQPIVADIAKMPHVLVAGATGSGKSVCVNTIMCSILFRASPDEVKFILVDPKRVELIGYNDIPHLLTPVIMEPKKVVSALKWAVHEMENRYKKLAEVGVKNISDYNDLAGHVAMSSIVIVIDELADIMMVAPSEVEESITRLAQMARAVGMHLVLATQRPSVDVLTGLIKANVPTRIAFNVSAMTDSRVILDGPGAEKLLGKGDMLYLPADKPKPMRVQGTYVTDGEIRELIKFVRAQGMQPDYQEEITTKFKSSGGAGGAAAADGETDELFDEVAEFMATQDKASSSMLQRHFSVGYNRAAKIIDQMHAAGMVGPANGSKPREVYPTKIAGYLQGGGEETG